MEVKQKPVGSRAARVMVATVRIAEAQYQGQRSTYPTGQWCVCACPSLYKFAEDKRNLKE